MTKIQAVVYTFFLCLLLTANSFYLVANNPEVLQINKDLEKYNIYDYVGIFRDDTKEWTINDILNNSDNKLFKQTHSENLNFGFSKSPYWINFSLKNNTKSTVNLLLKLRNPDLNFVDYYETKLDSNKIKILRTVNTGELRTFNSRDVNHRDYAFKIKLEPGEEHSYFLRVFNNGDAVFLPLILRNNNIFIDEDYIELLFIGLIFGLFIFIILYNLFLYITINDIIYIYYSLYILFLSLFCFNVEGLSYQFLWRNLPWWSNHSTVFFMSLSLFFLLKFSMLLINTNSYSLVLTKIILFLKYVALINAVMSLLKYPFALYTVFIAEYLCVIIVGVLFTASIVAIYKKFQPAYFFVAAFVLMSIGVILYILRDAGIIPDSVLSLYGPQLGLVSQSLLLSLAVLDRFRRTTREANNKLQEQTIQIQHSWDKLENANLELRKLSLVASETDNSIAIFDNHGDLEWVNSGFVKHYGYSLDEIIKAKGRSIVDTSNNKNIAILFSDCIITKQSQMFDSPSISKTGNEIWTHTTLTPILNDLGKIEKFIAIESDITLLKNIEKDLQNAKEKAETADKLKTSFLSNMSHEIRTPMNAIIGFSSFLNDPDITEQEKLKFVKLINNSCDTLLHLIDDILDIAKIESGEMRVFSENFDLHRLLNEIYNIFDANKAKLKKENINFILSIKNQNQAYNIISDKYRLQQVIINLLTNAFKFTEKGSVEYGYEIIEDIIPINDVPCKSSTCLKFYIKDSGIGIAKDKRTIIFDRFRKIDDNKSKLYGGTGLGLAISKNLIELLGGKIWVESEEAKGSVFYFSIPLKTTTVEENLINIEEDNIYNWKDKLILIAEDEENNFIVLKEILKKSKIKIIWAKNGEEALSTFQNSSKMIDLILMDIKMPKMDGYEAIINIKKINKHVPIISVTAYAMAFEKQKCFEAGSDDYISKPVEHKRLLSLINHYLNKNFN